MALHKGPSFPPRRCLSRCWTPRVLACGSKSTALPPLCPHHVLHRNKHPSPHCPSPSSLLFPKESSFSFWGEKKKTKKPSSKCNFTHFLLFTSRNISPIRMSFHRPELLLLIQRDLASLLPHPQPPNVYPTADSFPVPLSPSQEEFSAPN